jgi:hypothetical protein
MSGSFSKAFFILLMTAAVVLMSGDGIASAQLGRIKDVAGKLGNKAPNLSSLLDRPPITTSLPDAQWAVDSMDSYNPPAPVAPLTSLERTFKGGFILRQGYYQMQAQSYCLKAGTHGPGGGDGYLYAPPKGPAEDAVVSIVQNSEHHSEIPQHDIQILLWAIIARAKFEDLAAPVKLTASRLLTPQQIAMLNRSGLDMLPGPAMQRLMGGVPGPVRQVLEAEANLRQMLTNPGSSFADMERVAVLTGMAPLGEGSRSVPSGRWSLHPDGYYVRYIPSGYSSTRVEIWVPEESKAVGKEFDPALHIAVPGNTARQRLIQSGRAQR